MQLFSFLKFKQNRIFIFFCFVVFTAFSQNPVTNKKGVSDPHIRVFNDKIYLYSGHDDKPTDPIWVMKDWRIFSTDNLVDWKHEGTISPKDNYMGVETTECWAGDAMKRNGQYYFYFSDQKRGIGVMKSDSPLGPFKDVLGKPLVAPLHDPTIFIEDNVEKTPYMIYGDKSDAYFMVRLNDNMVSTAETPKRIEITGKEWEAAPVWMDKNYFFKYKDTYYLSWGRDYATSKNIYGPYTSVGAVGNGHNLDQFAHGSFFWWKGQFYHIWCYYINKRFKFRESIITYCHFDDDGKIVTDTNFLDEHYANGVGQYNASWDTIEAEWYYEISKGIEKKGTRKNGFVLSNIQDKSWVKFANVHFDTKFSSLEAILKNVQGKGNLEIRLGSTKGKCVGKISVAENGILKTDLKKIEGIQDVYLVFSGEAKFSVELDSFRFL